ncbi:MAG: C25 family peptidase propeptide domain-containing protein, partial [Planctomycetota bacterium]
MSSRSIVCTLGALFGNPLLTVVAVALATPVLAGGGVEPVTVVVQEDTPERIILHYELGDFSATPVMIEGQKYAHIALGKESPIKIAGTPELPNVCRSIIIGDDAEMAVRVVESDSEYYDVEMSVAPSKGHLPRTINPADVPYTFGDVYRIDAFYPGELATLREPYILRDHRGIVVELNPFQYNPVKRTLRVYTEVTLEIVKIGPGRINVLKRKRQNVSRAFHEIYRHHFLNFAGRSRYTPLDETGDMLIICHDAWIPNTQPLADHKNLRGIDTTVVGVSTTGTSSTAIKNYVQNVYDSSDLAFVLLVGDAAQVATPYASGGS